VKAEKEEVGRQLGAVQAECRTLKEDKQTLLQEMSAQATAGDIGSGRGADQAAAGGGISGEMTAQIGAAAGAAGGGGGGAVTASPTTPHLSTMLLDAEERNKVCCGGVAVGGGASAVGLALQPLTGAAWSCSHDAAHSTHNPQRTSRHSITPPPHPHNHFQIRRWSPRFRS
jgi:hypothetical protein